jgi:hypothetical protein
MAKTLLLDTVTWDLLVDASGNLAVADAPYALAQDAASAIRLFQGELWYDTTQGVPYFAQVLGEMPSLGLLKTLLSNAALTVPSVVNAVCYIDAVSGRRVSGQVQITDATGTIAAAAF